MEIRKISKERCEDIISDKKGALKLDFRRAQFIVKKEGSSIGKIISSWSNLEHSRSLLSLWFIFSFSQYRYRPEPGSVMIGLALIRGMQTNLTYGAFYS